ncbi:ubiquitin family protein [Limnochorda pilosa]|uniref:Chemotaxis protein CheV n=1 Tax=Limnochorda pilosa TaxID=1555112 RepID=A0A0K2SKP4_LIMPI|nr:hypothetical protein [Limnochorda pilosa]BAS27673.1 chemotaxis protein CheV [Limnochorda pilosa]
MIRVHLPRGLVELYGRPATVDVEASTPMEALEGLEREQPGIMDRLCERPGVLRPYVLLFVDGERWTDLDAHLPDEGEMHIVGALAGG